MLKTLAVANYRSINKLVIPLGRLNLITGPNGSGKSNLYRALRLLAETAQGGVVNALAREGGLDSTFWAGPETITRRMRNGEVPIEATVRHGVKRLRLGFAGEDFSYSISLGLPDSNGHFMLPEHSPIPSRFSLDPQIKRECIWAGPIYRPASLLVDRDGPMIRARAKAAAGMCWPNTRRISTACSIRSAACVPRRRCWRCASSSVAGASTIIFAATPTPRCASRNWAPARRCCTTTAATWRRRCRPSSKSATPRRCSARSATRFPVRDCISSRWPADGLPSSFIRKGCCGRCRPPSCRTERCAICCWWRRC